MASLTVLNGPDRGRRFELPATAVVGRDARSSIRLHDDEISRGHAEIRRDATGYVVRDLNSSNGSFVNGKRIDVQPLRRGDRIRIGKTEMLFSDGPAETHDRDLASRIDMLGRAQPGDASAILRSIKHTEGSQLLLQANRSSVWLQNALANLAVMYETSQAISRIGDIAQLLDHIMNLVFQSIKADRGCMMLRDAETGALEPTSIRYAAEADRSEKIHISQTIVDWVLREQEGVIVLDAAQDQRFGGADSVAQLGIREAICVPLRGRHETLGVIYIDTKTDRKQVLATGQPSQFSDDHLKLMIAIAHQAGLAVEDNRFHQAMVQAERLAAIGQTIAAVSHHIKNILQGVRSGNDLVEMGLADSNLGLVRHGWGVVRKNQERIYNLVTDMLSYSKERQPHCRPADLNELVREVVAMAGSTAKEKGVVLETKLKEDLPHASVDEEAIHRALLNLVGNAVDAVDGVHEPHVLVESKLSDGGDFIEIAVADSGCGIPEEMVERVFQVFVSTKGSRGTGLGLPVSRKILREHDGDLTVTSEVGKGTCFVMHLPLKPDGSKHSGVGLRQD